MNTSLKQLALACALALSALDASAQMASYDQSVNVEHAKKAIAAAVGGGEEKRLAHGDRSSRQLRNARGL